jgi:hypothetical protein
MVCFSKCKTLLFVLGHLYQFCLHSAFIMWCSDNTLQEISWQLRMIYISCPHDSKKCVYFVP